MFFEQYSHEPFIATSRFWLEFGMGEEKKQALAEKQAPGYAALGVMERRLAEHPFLVGDRYTVADIALYAYTHVAHEGNFNLENYPAIRAWLEKVRSQPNHILITQSEFPV
jgi:glutathione S-transferase